MATPLGPRRSPPSSLTPQLCPAALGAVRALGQSSAEPSPKPAPRHDAAAAPAPLSRLTVGLAAGGSRESPWPRANGANPELASESSAGSAAGCGGQCRRGTRRGGLRSPRLSACRADGDASARPTDVTDVAPDPRRWCWHLPDPHTRSRDVVPLTSPPPGGGPRPHAGFAPKSGPGIPPRPPSRPGTVAGSPWASGAPRPPVPSPIRVPKVPPGDPQHGGGRDRGPLAPPGTSPGLPGAPGPDRPPGPAPSLPRGVRRCPRALCDLQRSGPRPGPSAPRAPRPAAAARCRPAGPRALTCRAGPPRPAAAAAPRAGGRRGAAGPP